MDQYGEGQGGLKKGPNARADIKVTLEELYNGSEKDM